MHPLLTRNRFGFYLAAWLPLAAILILLMTAGGRLGFLEASFVVLPLCLLYAFICLSSWYMCKSVPIRGDTTFRLFLSHSTAAVVLSFLWVALALGIVRLLSQSVQFQGLDKRFPPQIPVIFGAGILIYLLAVSCSYVILSIEASSAAEARVLETNVLAREAELKALKAQVNPHFLFNSLNSISALTSMDAAKAREMCIYLADFLRMTLGLGEKNVIPLDEELSLIDRFLAIEQVRFGSRLKLEKEISEDSRAVSLPPLILQPLIENAILHGIANLPEGGAVRLATHCSNGTLIITVENSLDPDSPPVRRGGLGLTNVRRRLEARYGGQAAMTAGADSNRFRVVMRIPMTPGGVSR